jgi:hypothetical protein
MATATWAATNPSTPPTSSALRIAKYSKYNYDNTEPHTLLRLGVVVISLYFV